MIKRATSLFLVEAFTLNLAIIQKNKYMGYYVHPSSIIDEGCQIGEGTKIWHFSHIMQAAIIGNDCNLGQNVFVDNNVTIGNKVKIQNNVSVYHGVVLENEVFIGPSVVFTNVINPRSFITRKNEFKQTLVKTGATVGANATIICGITIGEYSMIGAGSVVTKDVLPYALVVGNPSKQIFWISKAGARLDFSKNNTSVCPITEKKYILENNRVTALL